MKAARQTTTSRPLIRPATVLLTLIVVVGGLWALNNTTMGLTVKCHLLGDSGACLEEALLRVVGPRPPSSDLGTSDLTSQGCALQLQDHDASILVGTGGAGCETVRTQLASIGTWLDVDMRTAASVGSQLCEGDWNGIHIQVLDTGGQIYGTMACQELGLAP